MAHPATFSFSISTLLPSSGPDPRKRLECHLPLQTRSTICLQAQSNLGRILGSSDLHSGQSEYYTRFLFISFLSNFASPLVVGSRLVDGDYYYPPHNDSNYLKGSYRA